MTVDPWLIVVFLCAVVVVLAWVVVLQATGARSERRELVTRITHPDIIPGDPRPKPSTRTRTDAEQARIQREERAKRSALGE